MYNSLHWSVFFFVFELMLFDPLSLACTHTDTTKCSPYWNRYERVRAAHIRATHSGHMPTYKHTHTYTYGLSLGSRHTTDAHTFCICTYSHTRNHSHTHTPTQTRLQKCRTSAVLLARLMLSGFFRRAALNAAFWLSVYVCICVELKRLQDPVQ